MTFEEAKKRKEELNDINTVHSNVLQGFEKNAMGLVSDETRATPEWQQAQKDFNQSFAELRKFNAWFVKEFKRKRSR